MTSPDGLRVHGMVTFSADDVMLRAHGHNVFTLGEYAWRGMDYTYLAGYDGEVQVFRDYRARVSAARAARAQVLGGQPLTPDAEPLAGLRGEHGLAIANSVIADTFPKLLLENARVRPQRTAT